MGKVSKMRKKAGAKGISKDENPKESDSPPKSSIFTRDFDARSSMYRDCDVKSLVSQGKLPEDFDTTSTVTSRTFRGLGIKKKDKMRVKHHVWALKMAAEEKSRQDAKETAKRKKVKVTGDMRPLLDSLPSVDLVQKSQMAASMAASNSRKGKKSKSKKGKGRGQSAFMADIQTFKGVLDHPAFKANPTATVTEHLTNRMALE